MTERTKASVKNRIQFFDSLGNTRGASSSVAHERGQQVSALIYHFEDMLTKGIKLSPSMRKLYQETVRMKTRMDEQEAEYRSWFNRAAKQLENGDIFYNARNRFDYDNAFIIVPKRSK